MPNTKEVLYSQVAGEDGLVDSAEASLGKRRERRPEKRSKAWILHGALFAIWVVVYLLPLILPTRQPVRTQAVATIYSDASTLRPFESSINLHRRSCVRKLNSRRVQNLQRRKTR